LRLKILKKLRTASLNSEFTGSYEKSVLPDACVIKQALCQQKLCFTEGQRWLFWS